MIKENFKTTWKYLQSSSAEQQQKDWAGCLKHIGTVRTLPELLHTLDRVEMAGLENFLDLNYFKQNTGPMWEDPCNVNGGRIIVEIPLSQKEKLPELWRRTTVFCSLEPYEGINGAVYAEKANYRISVWIGDASNAEEIMTGLKKVLETNEASFSFTLHSSRQGEQGRYKKKNNRGH